MIDVKTADRELQLYIRPQTFPVAIRMLRPGEEIPEKARRPARDFKKLSMNCQVIDMARRYGWMIALTREDHICSLGIAALGFEKPTHLHTSGTLCEGTYTETKAAGQRSEAAVDKFAPGEFAALLVAPLARTTFEPHLVCIYANPAQVMRLTHAALWQRGATLTSAARSSRIATPSSPRTAARSPIGSRSIRSSPRSPARSRASRSRSTARTCPRRSRR